jgi:NADP-dependent 3-hydroxy acid dehydrogenase YdfG
LAVRLVGRNREKLERVVEQAGSEARVAVVDITKEPAVAGLARAALPTLDVLVHSAGAYLTGTIDELDAESWAALDAIKLHAPILLTRACLPALRAAPGQVVFVNSQAGLSAGATTLAYAAGKQALRAATDALRQTLNPDGIRVLSVFPGRTDTPMQQAILEQEKRSAGEGMLMQPEDVAAMVVAALKLPRSAEVTDIVMRPLRPLRLV